MDNIVIHSISLKGNTLKLRVTCRCGIYHPQPKRAPGALTWGGFTNISGCMLIFHCYGYCKTRVKVARDPIQCLVCLDEHCDALLPIDEGGKFVTLTCEGLMGRLAEVWK